MGVLRVSHAEACRESCRESGVQVIVPPSLFPSLTLSFSPKAIAGISLPLCLLLLSISVLRLLQFYVSCDDHKKVSDSHRWHRYISSTVYHSKRLIGRPYSDSMQAERASLNWPVRISPECCGPTQNASGARAAFLAYALMPALVIGLFLKV